MQTTLKDMIILALFQHRRVGQEVKHGLILTRSPSSLCKEVWVLPSGPRVTGQFAQLGVYTPHWALISQYSQTQGTSILS